MSYLGSFFTGLFLLPLTLFAQTSLGIEGGLSNNSYHTNVSNRAATVVTSHTGISIGLPLDYTIHSWLHLAIDPGLVQKGYSMNRTDSLLGEYDQHVNTYLQLPVAVSFVYSWRRMRVNFDPGLYAAYWLAGRIKGQTADIFGITDNTSANGQSSSSFSLSSYSGHYSFLANRDNRWEFGWTLGLGLHYHLQGPIWLNAGVKFYEALTSQEKAAVSPIPAYNQTWIYALGASWVLKKL